MRCPMLFLISGEYDFAKDAAVDERRQNRALRLLGYNFSAVMEAKSQLRCEPTQNQ